MHMVTEVQRAMLDVEAGRLDVTGYEARLAAIRPLRYPRWLVSLMIGLSCACFAELAGKPILQGAAWRISRGGGGGDVHPALHRPNFTSIRW